MAMTNETIIMMESIKLMEQGVIKGSGIWGTTIDGKPIELPEALHTFAHWKSLGYSVKKGEKAKAAFSVWKYVASKGKKDAAPAENEKETENGYCRMKLSYFFTFDQVEPLKKEKTA